MEIDRLRNDTRTLPYRADIDGLRAVAVTAVIFAHLNMPGFSGGFVGVDIFFAISGYLITSIILKDVVGNHFSLGRFYERRIRRIFPALFLLLAVTLPVSWHFLLPGELRAYCETLFGTALFSSNFVFWHQAGYFTAQSSTKPLLHTWSLGIEEQFYIVFPLAIILVAKLKQRGWIVVGLAIVCLCATVLETNKNPNSAFFLPQYRAWELLAGAALAYFKKPNIRSWTLSALTWMGALLIASSIYFFNSDIAFPGFYVAIPVIGTLLILRSGDLANSRVTQLLSFRPVVLVGKISYSLYLWHWPLIAYTSYYLVRPLNVLEKLTIVGTTLFLASISWIYVEQPNRKFALDRRFVFAIALMGTVFFSGLGALGYFANGFPQRFPQADIQEYKAMYNVGKCQVDKNRFEDWSEAVCTFPPSPPPGTLKLLVWGDSFASQYVNGLQSLKTSQRLAIVQGTVGACPPLIEGKNARDIACESFNLKRLNRTLRDKPDIVLIAGIWRGARDLEYLRSGVEPLLDKLSRAGIKVLLIGDPPLYYSDIPQIQRMLRARGDNTQWYTPYSALWGDPVLKKLANKYGAAFFSPQAFFCIKDKCRFTDGQLFTFDDGHLTAHGSEMIAKAMKPDIEALIRTRTNH